MHTAVASLLEPLLLRSAAPADRACRPGHVQHRAVLALWRMAREHRFALHLDVRSYFPSFDLGILRGLSARRIEDACFFAVVERILEAGRGLYDSPLARHHSRFDADWPPLGQGLPMGAVTSQLFAGHLYLTAMDQRLLRDLRVPGYPRYVDDLCLFADRRADLRAWRSDIGAWLASERHPRLKHPNARIVSCAGHLDGLGFRIRRDGVEPLPAAQRRVVRRMRELLRDPARSVESIDRSLRAMAGHQFLLRGGGGRSGGIVAAAGGSGGRGRGQLRPGAAGARLPTMRRGQIPQVRGRAGRRDRGRWRSRVAGCARRGRSIVAERLP